ncbi:MAG: acyltransferase [Candidatus Electrothrix sp. AUS4]|nr:acyltransferase [Candidatus Electrothrix sp. AUS4]
MSWLSSAELQNMGFSGIGNNTFLSRKASYYNCKNISIGNNVRIDDFCVLSAGKGKIIIGDYIHIAVYSSLIGAGSITLDNYCNISSRVSIYSSNDDYSGNFMTNPTIPSELKNVQHADVEIGQHVIVGSGSIILPGVILGEGVAIGALSLVTEECKPFGIYAGIPASFLKKRSTNILKLEEKLKKNHANFTYK